MFNRYFLKAPSITEGAFLKILKSFFNSSFITRYDVKIILFCSVSQFACHVQGYSQGHADTLKRKITLELEIRPRAEFRKNYILPPDTTASDFHVSQRNRIRFTYQERWFKFHTSFQEIHLWGKSGTFSQVGSVNAYELFIEPSLTKNLSVRIGRQGISLDNGRMFSDAPWSQQSRAHEGIRLMYNKPAITSDLIFAFTRKYSDHFDAAYSPVSSHRYKMLFLHHGKYKLSERYALTTINAVDVFERTANSDSKYFRATSGGRIEFESNSFYLTLSAFYQFGENESKARINAYYFQPEFRYSPAGKFMLRLGAEILSGNDPAPDTEETNSFVPLYGVAWKFMGNMNMFTRFPADVKDRGLIDPYLFVTCSINDKISLRSDYHLFFAQHSLLNINGDATDQFLGFENDISLRYRPSLKVDITFGFSYALTTGSMELLDKVQNSREVPVWSYLMISYRPAIFSFDR